MAIKTIDIPYLPLQVLDQDICVNGKLFPDYVIEKIKEALKKDGRYRFITANNQQRKLRYAIIVKDGSYFAVYDGKRALGKGYAGKVKLAQDLMTGEWVALKVQELSRTLDPDDFTHRITEEAMLIETESMVLSPLKNPVCFLRYSPKKQRVQQYLLMTIAKGREVFDWVSLSCKIPFAIWLDIILKALLETKALHERHILHCDIKPENMFYDLASRRLRLVDLGFAVHTDATGSAPKHELCGTIGYVAPEICCDALATHNEKTEIYALGASFAYSLGLAMESSGIDKQVFCDNFLDPAKLIDVERYYFQDPDVMSKVRSFLMKMVDNKSSSRPTLKEAIDFFKQLKLTLPPPCNTVKVAFKCTEDPPQDLSSYDMVCLLDAKDAPDMLSYTIAKAQSERDGVTVCNKIYYGLSKSQLLQEAPTQFIQQEGTAFTWEFYDAHTGNRLYPDEQRLRQGEPNSKKRKFFGLFQCNPPPPLPAATTRAHP